MPTERPAACPPPPVIHLHDADPNHDSEASSSYSSEHPTPKHSIDNPQIQPSPDFAQQQAPNVLLVMGVVLFLLGCAGCAAYVVGHPTIAEVFVGLGLLVVIFSSSLKRLVLLKLDTKLGALMAKFGLKDFTDDEQDSDGPESAEAVQ